MKQLSALEICAGAGGQALGLERAGFHPLALIEVEPCACNTLRTNRPNWHVIEQDLTQFSAVPYAGKVDVLAGGVPCPPFSRAGKQLGAMDQRNLFPEVVRLVGECRPKAVMIENVRGLLDRCFDAYRAWFLGEIESLGYVGSWRIINAADHGVPQLRPRAVFVALQHPYAVRFHWPSPSHTAAPTVGEVLHDQMASRGWTYAAEWRDKANRIAPTLVGGSKKHGGPDLGPSRARKAWSALGVDGRALADEPPSAEHVGMPRLTVRMAATLQGFPGDWVFVGKKTSAYRQIGNAFPPPVAQAVGIAIREAILRAAAIVDRVSGQEVKAP